MVKSYTEMYTEMNLAAAVAAAEFPSLKTVDDVREWWKRHFMKAGHKRLAYILMGRPWKEVV